MKLNNKGITLVEVIVSFALLMIILVGLFNIIMEVRSDVTDRQMEKEFKDFDFSSIKGEMVIVIEGNKEIKLLTDEDIISLLKDEIDKGSSIKDAIKNISQNYSLKKNYVYQLANSIKK